MDNIHMHKKYTEEEYDEYMRQIRDVLYDNRHITKYQLMNGTGIPMDVIRHLINEGRIEEKIDKTLVAIDENTKIDKVAKFREQVRASGMLKNNKPIDESKLVSDLRIRGKYHNDGR